MAARLIVFLAAAASVCMVQSAGTTNKTRDVLAGTGLNSGVIDIIRNKLDKQYSEWSIETNEIPSEFDEETEKLMKILEYIDGILNSTTSTGQTDNTAGGKMEKIIQQHKGQKRGKQRNIMRKGKNKMMKAQKKMQKMLRKDNRKHITQLWDLSKVPKQCVSMTSKIEHLCSRVDMARTVPALNRLYLKWMEKTKGRGAWNTCCNLQSAKERLSCFEDTKKTKRTQLCAKKTGKSRRYTRCCSLPVKRQSGCFDSMKERACAKFYAKGRKEVGKRPGDFIPPNQLVRRGRKGRAGKALYQECCSEGRKRNSTTAVCAKSYATWAYSVKKYKNPACAKGFITCCANVPNLKGERKLVKTVLAEQFKKKSGSMRRKHSGRRGRVSTKVIGQRNGNQKMLCCKAGKKFREGTTVESCERGFEQWSAKKEVPSFCGDKFVTCCMSKHWKRGGGKGRKRWRNVTTAPDVNVTLIERKPELPDETGQEVTQVMEEEKMEVTSLCCELGRSAIDPNMNKEDWKCGDLLEMVSENRTMDKECIAEFTRCCNAPRSHLSREVTTTQIMEVVRPIINSKRHGRKKEGKTRRGGKRKLSKGMRRASNGQYYHVDRKAPPSKPVRRINKRINRKG